jgi:hypothetical protein
LERNESEELFNDLNPLDDDRFVIHFDKKEGLFINFKQIRSTLVEFFVNLRVNSENYLILEDLGEHLRYFLLYVWLFFFGDGLRFELKYLPNNGLEFFEQRSFLLSAKGFASKQLITGIFLRSAFELASRIHLILRRRCIYLFPRPTAMLVQTNLITFCLNEPNLSKNH